MPRILRLRSGQIIAYDEYGLKKGHPVFFFHGTPGSRYFHPPDEITKKLGVHLITIDRPGYGFSDDQPNRRILDFPEVISQLADSLKLKEFSVAGHSGGGPYTLACAYALKERVKAAASISGAIPPEIPGFIDGMIPINQFGFKIGKYLPYPLWRLLVWFVYHRRSADPLADMERGNGIRPKADDDLLLKPIVKNTCLQSEIEAFRFGLQGVASDARLLTYPWGFKLENIPVPVFFWHGTTDDMVPAKLVHFVAEKISHSHLHIFKDEGHLLLFKHWEEILTSLIRA